VPVNGATTARIAEVISVDVENRTVIVQTKEDGHAMQQTPISLDNASFQQYVPVPGQQVLIGDIFSTDLRILAIFGDTPRNVQRSKPIDSGEILSQGSGGGFYYADKSGNAMLSDKTLSNVIQLLVNNKIGMAGKALFINIHKTGQIKITPGDPEDELDNGTIEIIKTNSAGKKVASITIGDDKIEVTGDTVEIGPLPIASSVVTLSGVNSPVGYSFDSFGVPIPGSRTVKESL
jgi:hypothetical protein